MIQMRTSSYKKTYVMSYLHMFLLTSLLILIQIFAFIKPITRWVTSYNNYNHFVDNNIELCDWSLVD